MHPLLATRVCRYCADANPKKYGLVVAKHAKEDFLLYDFL